uniref:7TM GPCR serpentine receptor class x (Srx) domain-containing protein n=1 Tax=Trepomonas sp. PC1 TaxID=1076344 RepID=A0A146JZP8_9EUKA|eukprot:JAP88881.1 Hypothetical protein TPC1_31624 [Trepomonas sp. PC1]
MDDNCKAEINLFLLSFTSIGAMFCLLDIVHNVVLIRKEKEKQIKQMFTMCAFQQLGFLCQLVALLGYTYPSLYKDDCYVGYHLFDLIVGNIGRFFNISSFLMHLNKLNTFLSPNYRPCIPGVILFKKFKQNMNFIWFLMSVPFIIGIILAIIGQIIISVRGILYGINFLIILICNYFYSVYLVISIIQYVKSQYRVQKRQKLLTVIHGILILLYLVIGEAYLVLVIIDYFSIGENLGATVIGSVIKQIGIYTKIAITILQAIVGLFVSLVYKRIAEKAQTAKQMATVLRYQ